MDCNSPTLQTGSSHTGVLLAAQPVPPISPQELISLPAQALVLGSMEAVVNQENADSVQAEMVAEFANQPITSQANAYLIGKGTTILPDILCNAGGVTVSFFEQVQNATWQSWSGDKVASRLQRTMDSAVDAVADMAEHHNIDLRTAAIALAMQRIIEAHRARGLRM